jgi:membrane protease YdiL (CAAX protease family)
LHRAPDGSGKANAYLLLIGLRKAPAPQQDSPVQMQSNVQPSTALRSTNVRHPFRTVTIFFALACAFSWWGYALDYFTGFDLFAAMFPPGPFIAAIVIIAVAEGRPGLKAWWSRMRTFRAPVHFYVIGAAVPAAIALASAGGAILFGADTPDAGRWATALVPALILIIPMALFFGPASEELSFRGWGQDALEQRASALTTALALGVGVVAWHLPLIISGDIPWVVVFALPAVSVVYAWLYRASGSIWTAVTVHTSVNIVSGVYVGEVFDGGADVVRMTIMAALYVAWAAFIVQRNGRSLMGRQVPKQATGLEAPSYQAAPATH